MGLTDLIEAAKTELALANDEESRERAENRLYELELRAAAEAEGVTPNELCRDLTALDEAE